MSILSRPEFHDEEAAYAYVESKLWPNGPVCPHCGENERTTKMQGKSTRIGTYKCRACRKKFTVKIGTIFESSHVKMHLWLQAIYLMCSSKKGCSSNQLHRTLGVTLKTAWFMSHRIREAMRDNTLPTFGSGGGIVEVDETYMGKTKGLGKGPHGSKKLKVLSLVDRETKKARSMVIDKVTIGEIYPIVKENIAREAQLMTDQAQHYKKIGRTFAEHHSVNHGVGEYVSKTNPEHHTNTVENYFSVFKRGMRGVYQHCGKQHLHRYLAEYDFRYNYRAKNEYTDAERADIALLGVSGKRLTYQRING
ncbi:MAG: IS1595 family transposase [Halioglobus sp.]|nr:IS1595 family transposase [Halioglobus sp.]